MDKKYIIWFNLIAFALLAVLYLGMLSAGSVKIYSSDLKYKSDTIEVDMRMPSVSGMKDKALEAEINRDIKFYLNNIKESMVAEAIASSRDSKKQGLPVRPYQLVTRHKLTMNKSGYLSFYIETYAFTGGAHGMTYRRPYNIDMMSGKKLAIKDLFPLNSDYIEQINRRVQDKINKDPFIFFIDDNSKFKTVTEDQPFYLTPGNLVVYFELYKIAPYSSGMPEFTVPVPKLR